MGLQQMPEGAPESLQAVLTAHQIDLGDDATLAALQTYLQNRFGRALDAIIVYGSYLRGERDTLLDLYVLLNDSASGDESGFEKWGRRILAPNVYYLPASATGNRGHAKYAVVATTQLQRCIAGNFHSYFWSRLAQPCAVLYTRSTAVHNQLLQTRARAVTRCLEEALRLPGTILPDADTADADTLTTLWQPLFEHTYACELRAESPERARILLGFNESYYRSLAQSWLATEPSPRRHSSSMRPAMRRWLGKGLSLARLCKASLTFSNGIEYLLWKVQRHSGLEFKASARAHKYPLLFAWPLVWRVWRAGGFR
ncbi:MAG: hypothetical protein AB8B93_06365 [Pseudomonadales bacterium]